MIAAGCQERSFSPGNRSLLNGGMFCGRGIVILRGMMFDRQHFWAAMPQTESLRPPPRVITMAKRPTVKVQLVHLTGPLKGKIQEFSSFPIQIGRHSDCQVRFDKELSSVSRNHARIDHQGDQFRIVDTSTNGTYVNGKRISDVFLRDGDEISFSANGPKAGFLVQVESAIGINRSSTGTDDPLSDADLTLGPGMEIPVFETATTLLIQFEDTLQVFERLPVTVGSGSGCDLVLDKSGICAQHLQIFMFDEEFYLKDLTGAMAVTINGRPVGTHSVLAKGATVSLSDQGPSFRFIGNGKLVEVKKPT